MAKATKSKKLDPKKLFVIMTVSRATVAEMLNNALEDTEGEMDHVIHFSEDDPRLTDKVCQDIADTLYDALTNCDDDRTAQAEYNVYCSALDQFS